MTTKPTSLVTCTAGGVQKHSGVGLARRLVVPQRGQQAVLMQEALQHMPDVIIVHDIATAEVGTAGGLLRS
jgi:stage III sporulation protein SpoIIIAA